MADLFFESIFHGNNQFHGIKGWTLVGLLGCMLVAELYLMSEIMRIFDAVLIIPIYNSLQIFLKYILKYIGRIIPNLLQII